ncbi:MAG: hypothetical protein KGM49_15100 [Sphingomonadales bacterium]|nr:hypothetical protein [Sphingomonadales bacterium]
MSAMVALPCIGTDSANLTRIAWRLACRYLLEFLFLYQQIDGFGNGSFPASYPRIGYERILQIVIEGGAVCYVPRMTGRWMSLVSREAKDQT